MSHIASGKRAENIANHARLAYRMRAHRVGQLPIKSGINPSINSSNHATSSQPSTINTTTPDRSLRAILTGRFTLHTRGTAEFLRISSDNNRSPTDSRNTETGKSFSGSSQLVNDRQQRNALTHRRWKITKCLKPHSKSLTSPCPKIQRVDSSPPSLFLHGKP